MSIRFWFEVVLILVALVGWRRELGALWNRVGPRLGAYLETWFRPKPGS